MKSFKLNSVSLIKTASAILSGLFGMFISFYWTSSMMKDWRYVGLIFVLVSFTQFAFTPVFKTMGLYLYLSPMLLVYNPTKSYYQLHNGTSWDYLFNRKRMKSIGVKKTILIDFLRGLLQIIEKIENQEVDPNIKIEASSYFFSKRTAKRFGFQLEKPPIFVYANVFFNYIDLFWMYSLAHKRLRFPNLFAIKKAITTGEELIQQKSKIKVILSRLNKA